MYEVAMSKYDPLYNYLSNMGGKKVTLTIQQIEDILNFKLPVSAYSYPQWWSNSKTKAHPYCRSWLDAGYRTVDVKNTLGKQVIIFE